MRACVLLLVTACTQAPVTPEKPRVALVVLDGFGVAPDGPGNAIAQAVALHPDGFFARALVRHELPAIELEASGRCVGLPAGMMGNSEAGHSSMCAAAPVIQARTAIDNLRQSGAVFEAKQLVAAVQRAADTHTPLHLVGFMTETSSLGHWEHFAEPLRLAQRLGVRDVELHAVCDGTGQRACLDFWRGLEAVRKETGLGTPASLGGRDECFSRVGIDAHTRACVDAMRRPRTGKEPSLAQALAGLKTLRDASAIVPTALAGSRPIADDDVAIVLFYRRDDIEGLVRLLRHRETAEAPPAPNGPFVVTYGELDEATRYADDPQLVRAFDFQERDGFLHRELDRAGKSELRIAETKKKAHVTYFCDGGNVPDGPRYHRFHPESPSTESPCLASEASVRRAQDEMTRGGADFVMMNLPNANLLGHTGNVLATRRGIECLDRLVGELAATAKASGYTLFVTADHGNAEDMLRGGVAHGTHSTSPIPFVAQAPRGQAPITLVQGGERPCLSRVSWTVLDALGVERDARSLLAH